MTAISTQVMNFMIVGNHRSGYGVVQSSVDAHPEAVCHKGLLNKDKDVRQEHHVRYFGRAQADVPQWYDPQTWKQFSIEQYLTTRVFDHPRYGENIVGVIASYDEIDEVFLWEDLKERSMRGDFVIVHVKRNPLACFVSLQQIRQCGVSDQKLFIPSAVTIDAKELTEFCRSHDAHSERVSCLFEDRLEIDYRELVLNYRETMQETFDYLNLPPFPSVRPSTPRALNRKVKARIVNWDQLRDSVPHDVLAHFDDKYLF